MPAKPVLSSMVSANCSKKSTLGVISDWELGACANEMMGEQGDEAGSSLRCAPMSWQTKATKQARGPGG
jgi:hypothetical protein